MQFGLTRLWWLKYVQMAEDLGGTSAVLLQLAQRTVLGRKLNGFVRVRSLACRSWVCGIPAISED